jgi:pyruvate/2-oxoglutarate/acetoin dehydrogenase E1 component
MMLDGASQRNMLRQMVLVRAFEEKLEELTSAKRRSARTPIAAPLDKQTILSSAAKTKRAVVLDEGPMVGGISAEIAALIQENLFSDLRGRCCASQPNQSHRRIARHW